ncbi:unnamed protein product [Arctia plantaginis]|uniref:Uncharacterized protein n=1 Tax=Arctia plantaginis TaxID=874455 RepID=A0A8S1AWR2_ARCPL|nr:unnamed protein product [Arctia plantaginis]
MCERLRQPFSSSRNSVRMYTYNLQILGLSTVPRNGFSELRISKGLTFLYSGKENNDDRVEYGVDLLVSDDGKLLLLLETNLPTEYMGLTSVPEQVKSLVCNAITPST